MNEWAFRPQNYTGACFQAPRAAPGKDRWKHFILDLISPNGRWCNPISFFLCVGWWIICIDFTVNSVFYLFLFGKSFDHNPDCSCICQNNHFFFFVVNFSFYAYTPPSCACALVVFHPLSLIINHSYSSSCRWWCRKFIFFVLYTIIRMCHLISLIHMQHIQLWIPSYA